MILGLEKFASILAYISVRRTKKQISNVHFRWVRLPLLGPLICSYTTNILSAHVSQISSAPHFHIPGYVTANNR